MAGVTREQLLAAVSFCAEGHRFPGDCTQCPLLPFNSDGRCFCTSCISCIGNLLHAMREYIQKGGKS